VFEKFHPAPAGLQTFLNGKIDAFVAENDVASFGVGGNGTGYGRKTVTVQNCFFAFHEFG